MASDYYSRTAPLAEQEVRLASFVIHVDGPDDVLLERQALRLEHMMEDGWVEEVDALAQRYEAQGGVLALPAFRAIGYREIALARAAGKEVPWERLRVLTWQYARRQRTWNAKEMRHALHDGRRPPGEDLVQAIHEFFRGSRSDHS